MKKNLFKVLSLVLVALFAMTCVASAAAVEGIYSEGTVTATVTGIGTTDEVTILVVPHGTKLAEVTSDDILYIDQVTAAEGSATFTFTSDTEEIDIYSGYSSMDVVAGALSDIYEATSTPDPVEGPEIDTTKSKIYANAFIPGYQRIWIKLSAEGGQWMPAHSAEGSAIYYSTEADAYEGLIDSEAADLSAALEEISWSNTAPTADQTIAMYGDMTGDNNINVLDFMNISNLNNATVQQNYGAPKSYLTADVDGSNSINVLDFMQLKNLANAIVNNAEYTLPKLNQ